MRLSEGDVEKYFKISALSLKNFLYLLRFNHESKAVEKQGAAKIDDYGD